MTSAAPDTARPRRQLCCGCCAPRIRRVGARPFVLGTDLGQTGNPTPADGLQMFVAGLVAAGVSPAEIQTMGRETPGALLMG